MDTSNIPRIVSDLDKINEVLILALEKALARARDGNIEGFSLVILSDSVERWGYFEDRLRMVGALHMSLFAASNMADSS